MSINPRHRHEMTLHVGANTLGRLTDLLHEIADEIDREQRDCAQEVTSGAGWHFVIEHDATMTDERYDAELKAWWDEIKAARKAKP